MAEPKELSVTALERRRRKLAKRLDAHCFSETQAQKIIDQRETIDWRIAKTSARNLSELRIKITRLAAALHPFDKAIPDDCLEFALLRGLLDDSAGLLDRQH